MTDKIYTDIALRTGGDIYIGVVGPVRTGKSTFIKRFMDTLVLPRIENVYTKERARDELPQSGSGKTIMTAEPKFVPEDAIELTFGEQSSVKVRLIDCVGYMIEGALGQLEGDTPRMVSTPWFPYEIPMAQAAEVGTQKVITEHSTIGIVVTTDGTITDFDRSVYVPAEERVIRELKEIGKPFLIVINSTMPDSPSCLALQEELSSKYDVTCRAVNCQTMGEATILELLQDVLYEFPVREVGIRLPKWVNGLEMTHPIKAALYDAIFNGASELRTMRQVYPMIASLAGCQYVDRVSVTASDLGSGTASARVDMPESLFYRIIEDESGVTVRDEGDLVPLMRDYAVVKREYARISSALEQVRNTGYGIVMPTIDELKLDEPEIVTQGSRYGVRLRASAPSIHMIRADIQTEVSPIVGSEKQSQELIQYLLKEFDGEPEKLWQSNIFGKSLHELVNEGLNAKLARMPEDARGKLQETLQRIVNEGGRGLICIII